MRELERDFDDAGIAVRFVAIGDTGKVKRFCGPLGMENRCIADPSKATYAAMGFPQYNLLKLFTDRALKARRRENRAAGFRQNWAATVPQDGAQLPGAAFVDAAGVIRWMHAGKHPGDLPPMREMLAHALAGN